MGVDQTGKQFSKQHRKRIGQAWKLNMTEMRDIYHHPASQRIVRKCIDLSCQKPLHEMNGSHPTGNSTSPEKWLEAYLIQQAKKNEWILELDGTEYRLLFSQLNFKSEGGGKHARPLDLLLYEQDASRLVVLELKAVRQLDKAKEELKEYIGKVRKCQGEIIDIFKLGAVRDVVGYIVWPKNIMGHNESHVFGDYGVMEFVKTPKPWEGFKGPSIEVFKPVPGT